MQCEYEVYCLSFQNPARYDRMKRLFVSLGIDSVSHISNGVSHDDKRLEHSDNRNAWSCMYGHLDMIHDFYYHTTKPYGIFCEDDITIRKDFKDILPLIISDMKKTDLDVLLLGYLATFKVETIYSYTPGFQKIPLEYSSPFHFYHFNHPTIEIWGTQMYMLTRKNAKTILNRYAYESGYAERSIGNGKVTPFSADWTITKDGKRAIISPLVAVELYNYDKPYSHEFQDSFHRQTFEIHYNPEIHDYS